MRFILLLISTSLHAQVSGSLHEVLPNWAGSESGTVRLWNSSQTFRTDVKGAADQIANKVFRIPSEDAIAIGTQNHRYGTDSFVITATKARGSETSPSDVLSGDYLFQFIGKARSGGLTPDAASLTFFVESASPLTTGASLGLTVGGSFGTRYAFEATRFYGVGRPELGINLAAGRWGTIYGDSLDLLVPTGTTPAYETGSFIRAQTLELYDITGLSGGFGLSSVNDASNAYMRLVGPDGTTDLLRVYTKIATATTKQLRSYASILPDTTNTYNLGSDVLRWNQVWGTQVNAGTFRLAGNSNFWTTFNGGGSMSADVSLTWPSANASGALCNNGSGSLSWSTCGAVGGSGYPLGEAVLTDFFATYGGDATCTADCTAAFQAAVDSLGTRGGVVTAPAGCYRVSDTIVIGDGQSSAVCTRGAGDPWFKCLSTINSVTIRGAGTVVNAGTHPGGTFTEAATEIRWDPTVTPGSAKPIFLFQGPISGGGLEDMYININNVANVYAVEQIQHNRGTFEDVTVVTGRRLQWNLTTNNRQPDPYNNAFFGTCGNRYLNIQIDKPGAGQSGMNFDGGVNGVDSCSNVFIGGTLVRDANTAGTYSLRLRYADNNTFLRSNFFAYPLGASTSDPDVLFVQYSGSTDFPKENHFIGVSSHFGFGGTSGTGGNYIDNFNWSDCAVITNCIEFSMAYIKGSTDGRMFGPATDPPGPKFVHDAASTSNTFRIWQAGGGSNSVGAIAFQRSIDPIQFRISGDTGTGLSIWTATHLGTLTERWQFRGEGHLFPVTTNAIDLGGTSNRVRAAYVTTLSAQDVNSSTLNTLTPSTLSGGIQNNYLRADVSSNIYCEVYAATSAANERCAWHFYRVGGSYGSPAAVGNSWRLGAIFAWGYPSSNPSAGIEFYSASSGVNGSGIVPGEMRFSTQDNSGTRATRWIMKANGAIEPNVNATYDIGSSSFTAGHIYTNNITINGSCFGSGCASGGSFVTTNTSQTITGLKTFSGTRIDWNTASQENLRFYDNGSGGHYSIGVGGFAATMRFVKPSGTASFSFGSGSYSSYTEEVWFNQNYFDIGARQLSGSGLVVVADSLVPATSGTIDLGSASLPIRWRKLWVQDIDFNGFLTAPNGVNGISATYTCGAGQAIKTLTVSGGIVTNASCGVP